MKLSCFKETSTWCGKCKGTSLPCPSKSITLPSSLQRSHLSRGDHELPSVPHPSYHQGTAPCNPCFQILMRHREKHLPRRLSFFGTNSLFVSASFSALFSGPTFLHHKWNDSGAKGAKSFTTVLTPAKTEIGLNPSPTRSCTTPVKLLDSTLF